MRIVAGAARGRRLAVPPSGTRPTSDRVREAMFSTLESGMAAEGVAWADVDVLDLFAGSGALGLEALSRGARSAVLVESSRAAASVANANTRAVGLPGATVIVRDALRLATASPPPVRASLCLADPPYDWAADDVAALLDGLAQARWLAAGATSVVERPAKDLVSPLPAAWTPVRRRSYGDTALWYGRTVS
ncbi:MAG: 16S rRNA (guanine(966)-N(2))-methyltransferase RsmD [Actinomycetota bacterium]|nr:16S rRNA (guanine(966)-N(2))-methyltransferase RsmD [Actinomycetota bacterium]